MADENDHTTAGGGGDDDFPTWVAVAVLLGIPGIIIGRITGIHEIGLPAAVMLMVGSVAYVAHGGKLVGTWGKREQRSPAPAPVPAPDPAPVPAPVPDLVGSRISNGNAVFTVLDDSAVTCTGRRASVVAADDAGRVGLLFVGLDAAGRVTEARVSDGEWLTAAVVG
jgi:hypothetical protein